MPDMVPVVSSNLSSVGYEAETQTLYVTFTNGSTYTYEAVPEDVYQGLSAESVGKYLNQNVKGHYDYRKVS